ncbi:MAG: glycosyltransferase family 39 protein [Planctomycetes bacterium]|nr:glycosyltransferase family 39 protein [Planctomycetota bacterium]
MSVLAPPRSPPLTRRWSGGTACSPCSPLLPLAFACGLLFFVGLWTGPFYRTEGLRALVAAEMLRSGDWIMPTLYGQPLLTKPPGMYIAIAAASWPFGSVREWTARLPSAVAATLLVLLFARAFGRSLGRGAALVAGLTLPATVLWLDRVPSAEIDMVQVAWVGAALLSFLRALELAESHATPSASRVGTLWWTVSLLCVAGGTLTKWTAPAFFYLTVLPLLWWRGRLRLLLGRGHLLGVALVAGLCFAWVAAVADRAGWDVLRDTVASEAITKLSPAGRPGPYPWHEALLYPLRMLGACLPWSAAALLTLCPGFARRFDGNGQRLLQFLHCWAWPNLLFWSLARDHALRHSLPLVPGIAGLSALAWHLWLTDRLRWPLGRCSPRATLIGLLGCWLVVKLVFVAFVVPERTRNRCPRERGELLASLVPPRQMLYLFGAKDEGILFYYGRPARRLPGPDHLPALSELVYCMMTESEWRRPTFRGPKDVVARFPDEQGQPLMLVRVRPRHPEQEGTKR